MRAALLLPTLLVAGLVPSHGAASAQANVVATHQDAASHYGELPISFEANHGQADNRINFIARGSGYGLYLNGSEAVLALHGKTQSTPELVRMQLHGSNPSAPARGIDPLPGTANYFIGNDPAKWQTSIPTYARVHFAGVYPGTDLVYYGNQGQLEYDFIVSPQANPNAIRLHFAGAGKLAIKKDGDLTVSASHGKIAFHQPVIYQQTNGHRHPVLGRFKLMANNSVGFTLGRYDHSLPLIIDPVLIYSTYLGGSANDLAGGIAIDSAGNAYVAGTTNSIDFPVTSGAYQTNNPDKSSILFVSKFNPTGTALVYSTYLGGSAGADGGPIAIDSAGNAYVAGFTTSTDFPITPGAYQKTVYSEGDAFVTKLNPTGTALAYSTFLGGSDDLFFAFKGDNATGIAVDSSGDAYVTGTTYSSDFPVTHGAYQTENRNQWQCQGGCNAFVTKFNPTGTALVYSTYIGGTGTPGSGGDVGGPITVDAEDDAHFAGTTWSVDFPVTPGAFQSTSKDGGDSPSVFVTTLNAGGTGLVASTYLGGSGGGQNAAMNGDSASSIAVDRDGNTYVAGETNNPGSGPYGQESFFPTTTGAFESAPNGSEGFVTKLNRKYSALIYSTYFGPPFAFNSYYPPSVVPLSVPQYYGAAVNGIAVDANGNAYITGIVGPGDLVATQNTLQTTDNELNDTFVAKLNREGTGLLYSTYLGGQQNGSTSGNAVALGNDGTVYVTGGTSATDFPVSSDAFQTKNNSSISNAFVTRLDLRAASTIDTVTHLKVNDNPQVQGQISKFTATVESAGGNTVPGGTVVFNVNGSTTATVPLDSNGQAVYSTYLNEFTNPFQNYYVQALYLGDSQQDIQFSTSSASLIENIVGPNVTFSPAPGQYVGSVVVTLEAGPPIYYTTDGTTPTTSSPLYSRPFTLGPGFTTVRAINPPAPGVSEASYSVVPRTPTPALSLASGNYPAGHTVTITDADTKATIRYTTDGSTPTTKSNFYYQPIVLNASETINAIAISTADAPSAVASATYTVP